MKLTTRGHYSVKALLDLSLQPRGTPVSVKSIALRQDIPAAYLEKLLIEMRRAGLVRSFRGAQGGYQLARSANRISLGQILEAVGETIEPLSGYHPSRVQSDKHNKRIVNVIGLTQYLAVGAYIVFFGSYSMDLWRMRQHLAETTKKEQ